MGLGLGSGRQVVCTWLQVMDALNANTTIEHIGLFGNHDNMERPQVQSAPALPTPPVPPRTQPPSPPVFPHKEVDGAVQRPGCLLLTSRASQERARR